MRKGIVKFFNINKFFGFITDHESGEDIIVPSSSLLDVIREGDEVEFEVEQTKKGPVAVRVRVVR